MKLGELINRVKQLKIADDIVFTEAYEIELLNEVYTESEPNTAVIEWRYSLREGDKTAIYYCFETRALILEVSDLDTDLPVIENMINDSYNNAAHEFNSKGGTLPLCEPTQLNQTALRLLEAVVTLDLYQ